MKNKFMRIAAVMLMLCLVTTCAISGTFAKYTTEATATDTARVAKWGVTVIAPADSTANTTFNKTYAKDDSSFTLAADTVVATTDVIAPGTTGTLATPSVSGTPEVAVRVTLDATLALENWTVGVDEYCPLVFKVGTTEYKIDTTNDTIAKLIAAVEGAIEAYSADYAANTDLSANVQDSIPDVTWTWEYEGDDAKDTALGDATTAATISFSLKVVVTQIN